MKTGLAEFGIGMATALLSSLLVGGALVMSLTEGRPAAAPPPAVTETPPATTPESTPAAPLSSPTPTPTLTCPVPLGWISYTLQPGDTWEALAQQSGTTVEQLQRGNCNFNGSLLAGSLLNLPPTPSATPKPTVTSTRPAPKKEDPTDTPEPTNTPAEPVCGPPAGWVIYTVRPGDTLYQIGLRYNIVYTELMRANCLTSEKIISGQRLFVPNVTPRVTATSTSKPTNPPPPPPTATFTSPPPSDTPPPSPSPTTPAPSDTPIPPSDTPPPTPADTETPPSPPAP